jgi:dimethylargininase
VTALVALTRPVSPSIERCELTHLAREPIDYDRALAQHHAYERVLAALGIDIVELPALPDSPDGVFVEDTAVVFDELAIIARPGAESRRRETPSMRDALGAFRTTHEIVSPAMLDGGDVLIAGRGVYVGRSTRTNNAGIEQLRELVSPFGYDVVGVDVRGCLHLKTAVCFVADDVLVFNPEWISLGDLQIGAGVTAIEVHPDEPFAANALRIGDALVYGANHPRTRARIEAQCARIVDVDMSELAKAEGGVSCCSVVFSRLNPI